MDAVICLCSPQLDGRFIPYSVSGHMSPASPHTQLALLKPSDVAAQLGVSRSWVYDAAKAGRIPSIRIGGEDGPLRFVPEDVQRWIDDARAAWTQAAPRSPRGIRRLSLVEVASEALVAPRCPRATNRACSNDGKRRRGRWPPRSPLRLRRARGAPDARSSAPLS
jgi:excisionase family DNA binding protein